MPQISMIAGVVDGTFCVRRDEDGRVSFRITVTTACSRVAVGDQVAIALSAREAALLADVLRL